MPRPSKVQQELYENKICALVGRELEKHYSGYKWLVECNLYSGMVSVRNLTLEGEYGFYIGLDTLLNETDPKVVRNAGGEILERFKLDALPRRDDLIINPVGDLDA